MISQSFDQQFPFLLFFFDLRIYMRGKYIFPPTFTPVQQHYGQHPWRVEEFFPQHPFDQTFPFLLFFCDFVYIWGENTFFPLPLALYHNHTIGHMMIEWMIGWETNSKIRQSWTFPFPMGWNLFHLIYILMIRQLLKNYRKLSSKAMRMIRIYMK